MPTPKRRKFDIAQKRKIKKKRESAVRLTPAERQKVQEEKRKVKFEGSLKEVKWRNAKRLYRVCNTHRKNFVELVDELHRKFKGEKILLLDEGSGESSFPVELKQSAGPIFDYVRTDIAYGKSVTPEDLVSRFGKEKFHLIVSTQGGVQYTNVSRAKALANILACLKKGGIASIVTENSPLLTKNPELNWKLHEKKLRKLFDFEVIEERAGSIDAERHILTLIKK